MSSESGAVAPTKPGKDAEMRERIVRRAAAEFKVFKLGSIITLLNVIIALGACGTWFPSYDLAHV